MPTLLHLDSSPMGEYSVSRHLTQAFTHHWKKHNPHGVVIARDLNAPVLPPVNAAWVQAAYTPADKLTAEQKQLLALSDELIAELKAADEIVIGVPMYNFSIPAVLKLWIDQIVRAGVTFSYSLGGGYTGLVTGKKTHVIYAAGGSYGASTPMAAMNFVEPYLKAVLGFIGITDVSFTHAGGTSVLMKGGDRNDFMAPHLEAVEAYFSKE